MSVASFIFPGSSGLFPDLHLYLRGCPPEAYYKGQAADFFTGIVRPILSTDRRLGRFAVFLRALFTIVSHRPGDGRGGRQGGPSSTFKGSEMLFANPERMGGFLEVGLALGPGGLVGARKFFLAP